MPLGKSEAKILEGDLSESRFDIEQCVITTLSRLSYFDFNTRYERVMDYTSARKFCVDDFLNLMCK